MVSDSALRTGESRHVNTVWHISMFNFHGAAHRSDKSCESLFLFVVHTFLFCSFLDYSLRGHFTHRYKTILKLLLANVDIWGPIRLLFRNSEGFSAAFSAAFLACNLECPAENPSQHETRQSNRIGPRVHGCKGHPGYKVNF